MLFSKFTILSWVTESFIFVSVWALFKGEGSKRRPAPFGGQMWRDASHFWIARISKMCRLKRFFSSWDKRGRVLVRSNSPVSSFLSNCQGSSSSLGWSAKYYFVFLCLFIFRYTYRTYSTNSPICYVLTSLHYSYLLQQGQYLLCYRVSE